MTVTMKGASMVEGERIIEPLLYIDQPILQKPKAYMQDHYQAEKSMKESKMMTTSENQEDKEQASENNESSFKHLSVNEKIKYLVNLPREVPKIRCEVVTENKKFRGTVIEENDDAIVLRVFGRENATVKKAEILTINLIGF